MRRTSAVDDSASARPSASAAFQLLPRPISTAPISKADPASCIAPSPNTWRRIAHSRANESSSPTENSSSTMPSSAKGSSRSGSDIVT